VLSYGPPGISFIVEKDGSISNVTILRGPGHGCDEEVVRVISKMPAWTPGKIGNNIVRGKMVTPVIFKHHWRSDPVGITL